MVLRFDFKVRNDSMGNCTSKILQGELANAMGLDIMEWFEDPEQSTSLNDLQFASGHDFASLSARGSSGAGVHLRKKRFLPILAAGAFLGIASVAGLATVVYSVIEIQNIKRQQEAVRAHINALADFARKEHDDLVSIEGLTHSLYEYTHAELSVVAETIERMTCREADDAAAIITVLRRQNELHKLYVDEVAGISTVFEGKATPILLPIRAIRALMAKNSVFFYNTIYQEEPSLMYFFGSVYPVLPVKKEKLDTFCEFRKFFVRRSLIFIRSSMWEKSSTRHWFD